MSAVGEVTDIRLGNVSPIETRMVQVSREDTLGDDPKAPTARKEVDRDGKTVYLAPEVTEVGKLLGITPQGEDGPDGTVTVFRPPASRKVLAMVQEVATAWRQHHSNDLPEWVECDNPVWAAALAEEFSIDEAEQAAIKEEEGLDVDLHECRVGRPDGWTAYSEPSPIGGGALDSWLGLDEAVEGMFEPWELTRIARLRTNAGADFQARVMADTASNGTGSYAAANYLALSTDATVPAAGDTTLTGELTASGLGRAQATYAHTNGTTTYTLTKAYTSSDATPRTINKVGVFNATSVGTMVFETALASPPTLQSGDSLTVTETVALT